MIRTGAIALGNLTLDVNRKSGFYPDIVVAGPDLAAVAQDRSDRAAGALLRKKTAGSRCLSAKEIRSAFMASPTWCARARRSCYRMQSRKQAPAPDTAQLSTSLSASPQPMPSSPRRRRTLRVASVSFIAISGDVARGHADVALTQYHLISYWVRIFPNHFELVPVPGMERFFVKIAFGRVIDPLRPRALKAFEQFFFGRAREVYPRYDLARMSDDEFGATLELD